MVFLQLPEFTKEADECGNYFERWIYVLKNMEILNRMPWAAQYAAFQRLSQICETTALAPDERERYEESIKVYRDNLAIAQRAVEEGEEKGLAKGLAKGRAEGQVEGERKGRAEVARNLKRIGMSIADIAKATGLSKEEIEAL